MVHLLTLLIGYIKKKMDTKSVPLKELNIFLCEFNLSILGKYRVGKH